MPLFSKKYENSNPIEAQFADGFILNEDDQNDVSLFDDGRNTFYDILNRRCEDKHGPMVRFSIWVLGARIDIDWLAIPENAKPIRFKHLEIDQNIASGEVSEKRIVGITFGFEYFDKEKSRTIKAVREIT